MKTKKYKIYSIMYILLIASLPLFSVRFSFLYGGSLTLYILILIAIISFITVILSGSIKNVFTRLDFLIFTLVLISIISLFFKDNSNAHIAIYKTIVYFLVYLSLKLILAQFNEHEIKKLTQKGIYIGMVIFGLIILYAMTKAGGFKYLFSTFDYFNFTFRIFEQINLLTNDRDFSSKDVMRNALGEVFSFYIIFLLMTKTKNFHDVKALSLLFVNLFFLVITFSRRAFVSSIFSFYIILLKHSKKSLLSVMFLFAFFSVLIFIVLTGLGDENRLASLSISGRSNQFELAIDSISDSLIWGKGYGEKLLIPHLGEEVYIHNFVLSNLYMLGIPGLLISFIIFIYLLTKYLKATISKKVDLNLLLIIPIFGMLIGGTIEGMFTITSWIILALTQVRRKKSNQTR